MDCNAKILTGWGVDKEWILILHPVNPVHPVILAFHFASFRGCYFAFYPAPLALNDRVSRVQLSAVEALAKTGGNPRFPVDNFGSSANLLSVRARGVLEDGNGGAWKARMEDGGSFGVPASAGPLPPEGGTPNRHPQSPILAATFRLKAGLQTAWNCGPAGEGSNRGKSSTRTRIIQYSIH